MKRRAGHSAILFKCPTCGSRSLKACYTRSGRPVPRLHAARRKAAAWTWGDVMQVVKEHRT